MRERVKLFLGTTLIMGVVLAGITNAYAVSYFASDYEDAYKEYKIAGEEIPREIDLKEKAVLGYDYEMAREKDLCKEFFLTQRFLKTHAIYKRAFEVYLIKNTNIKYYDNMIKNSKVEGLDLSDVKKKNNKEKLFFIDINNAMHIERLSKSDLRVINKHIKNDDMKIDKELLDLVDRTYSFVIGEEIEDDISLVYDVAGYCAVDKDAVILSINASCKEDHRDYEKFNFDIKEFVKTNVINGLNKDLSKNLKIPAAVFCE